MTIVFGKFDLKKPTWTPIQEAVVDDGAGGTCVVKKGDFVALRDEYKDEVEEWLPGERPPHEIDHIAEWRCGRVSIYLRIKEGKETSVGIYSHQLKKAAHSS